MGGARRSIWLRTLPKAGRALAAFVVVTALAAPASATALSPLHVARGKLLDRQGREVVLRGVNVAYKVAPYYPNDSQGERSSFNERDARRLQRWGFDAIRLGVSWVGLEPERGIIDRSYIANIRRIVRTAARHGIYTLVGMHQDGWGVKFDGNGAPIWATIDDNLPWTPDLGFPLPYTNPAVGRSFTSFWQDRDGIQTEFIYAFSRLARSLRGADGILGYDVFNEPSCELGRPPCAFPPPASAAGTLLQPFYQRVIPALQRAAPGVPIFYEDWITASSGEYSVGEAPNAPLALPRLGLSYHVYCASADCEQGDAQTIARATRNARANGAFPLLTEFGATEDSRSIERVARLADGAGQSWLYWTYKTYFDPYPIFLLPPSVARQNGLADTWSIVAEDGRVKWDKVLALARPYPRVIAGQGASWRYDATRKVLALDYVPDRTGTTVVQTNAPLQYPGGYTARVDGGVIVSPRGARLLKVRSCRGARAVTLVLGPAGDAGRGAGPRPPASAARCEQR